MLAPMLGLRRKEVRIKERIGSVHHGARRPRCRMVETALCPCPASTLA